MIKKIKSQTYIISLIQKNNTVLIFFLTVLLLIGKMTYSSERFNSRDINFMQIQEWARFNSNPDSSYLVLVNSTYSGWRNYSRRAQISLNPTNGPYGVYIDTVLISDKVKNIVSKYPNDNLNFPSKSLLEELKSSLSLDFIVTSTSSDKYDFDIVFRNQDFIVYRI